MKVLKALGTCRQFTTMLDDITRDTLQLVFKSSGASKQRAVLEKLALELEKAITAADVLRDEALQALREIRPEPDFDETPLSRAPIATGAAVAAAK
jgi:hypothetical protein